MLTHIHNRYKLIFNVFFSNLFKINKKSLFICQYILYFLRFSIIPDIIVFYHKMVKYSPHPKKQLITTPNIPPISQIMLCKIIMCLMLKTWCRCMKHLLITLKKNLRLSTISNLQNMIYRRQFLLHN